MRKLDNEIIIIGAGLGGLSSAAYLAKNGFKVKIYERMNKAGGVVNSFKRGKYTFEATTHQMSGFGVNNYTKNIFKILGLENLELLPCLHSYETFYVNGKMNERYLLPVYENEIKNYLSGIFNVNNSDLKTYFNRIKSIKKDIFKITNVQKSKSKLPVFLELLQLLILKNRKSNKICKFLSNYLFKNLINYKNKNSTSVLKLLQNKKLISILSQYWYYTSLSPDELSAITLSLLNYVNILNPPFMVKKGSENLINTLVETITKNGGEIYLNKEVTSINVYNDKVESIIVNNNEEVKCNCVISDIDISKLFFELIDKDLIPDDYKEKIKMALPSRSMFQVYCGVKKDLKEHGLKASTNFLNYSHDQNKNYELSLNGPTESSPILLTNYSAYDDTFAPPGCNSVVLFEFDNIERWKNLNNDEYIKKKKETEELIIKKTEKVTGINIRNNMDIIFSATPLTFRKYSNNLNGGMIGNIDRYLAGNTRKISYETPILNLFLTGDVISSGVIPVLSTGIVSANTMIKSI